MASASTKDGCGKGGNGVTPHPRWRYGHHSSDLLKRAAKRAGKSKDPQCVSSALPVRNPDTDPPRGNFPQRFQACGRRQAATWTPLSAGVLAAQELLC